MAQKLTLSHLQRLALFGIPPSNLGRILIHKPSLRDSKIDFWVWEATITLSLCNTMFVGCSMPSLVMDGKYWKNPSKLREMFCKRRTVGTVGVRSNCCAKKWTPLTCGLGCLLCFFPALQTWNSWSLLLAFLVLYNSFQERFFGEAVCPVSNSLWVAVRRYKTPSEKQGRYSLKDVDLLLKCNPSSNNRSFLRRNKAV